MKKRLAILAVVLLLATVLAYAQPTGPTPPAYDPSVTPQNDPVIAQYANDKTVHEQQSTAIQIENITLQTPVVAQGGVVRGTVTFKSTSALYEPDIQCQLQVRGDINGPQAGNTFVYGDCGSFGIDALGRVTMPFTLTLPQALAGTYSLSVIAADAFDSLRGVEDVPFTVEGSSTEVTLNAAVVRLADGDHFAGEGPNVDPGTPVTLVMNITNPGAAVRLTPVVEAHTLDNPSPFTAFSGDPVDVPAQGSTLVLVTIPGQSRPAVYGATAYLKDDSGQRRSAQTLFKWNVRGASARIMNAAADSTRYAAGDTATVRVVAAGPADRDTSLGQVTIEATLSDSKGVVGTVTSSAVIDDAPTIILRVPVSRDTSGPQLRVRVVKDGQELASSTVSLGTEAPAAPVQAVQANQNLPLFVMGGILLVLIAAALFWWRKRALTAPMLFAVALILALAIIPTVNAWWFVGSTYQASGKHHTIALTWVNPTANSVWRDGYIHYSGQFTTAGCGNALYYWVGTTAYLNGRQMTFTDGASIQYCSTAVPWCFQQLAKTTGYDRYNFYATVPQGICGRNQVACAQGYTAGFLYWYACQYVDICPLPDPAVACADKCGDNITVTNCCGEQFKMNCSCVAPSICDTFTNKCSQPECSDGIDNNRNGYVDFTPPAGIRAEPGCDSALDVDEICNSTRGETYNSGPCPQCMDGVDNDGDGKADYPDDSGCSSPVDMSESKQIITPQVCEPDCTYTSDDICHIQCNGKAGCAMDAVCDSVLLGSTVTNGGGPRVCCQSLTMPTLNDGGIVYNTDRDRIRASRILKRAVGDSIVMQIINFK